MTVCGVVLAAGAGRRFGGPKALARTSDGTAWIARAVDTLIAAGCAPVLVALGAERDAVAALVPTAATIVEVPAWADGLSASVSAALSAAAETDADAALVVPVDTPDLPASACRRVMAAATPADLRQAGYAGRPGHPVLIGRAHWKPIVAETRGDRGAQPYLRAHGAPLIECGDLWHGRDIDRPR